MSTKDQTIFSIIRKNSCQYKKTLNYWIKSVKRYGTFHNMRSRDDLQNGESKIEQRCVNLSEHYTIPSPN